MFKVRPVIDRMLEFYEHPPGRQRFDRYLEMLQGNSKSDMELPIGGYNPMAKAHVSEKLRELKVLNAEKIIAEAVKNIPSGKEYEVVFNLADDLLGGWTNRYTTDYQSKFELNPLVQRGFCTPYFWTSETYSAHLIKERTIAQAYRTIYFSRHGKPVSLEDHVKQEAWVAAELGFESISNPKVHSFYEANRHTIDYSTIIAFLYGDAAAESLGFGPLGHCRDPLTFSHFIALVTTG